LRKAETSPATAREETGTEPEIDERTETNPVTAKEETGTEPETDERNETDPVTARKETGKKEPETGREKGTRSVSSSGKRPERGRRLIERKEKLTWQPLRGKTETAPETDERAGTDPAPARYEDNESHGRQQEKWSHNGMLVGERGAKLETRNSRARWPDRS
jgi:hypothetical protein